MDPIDPETVRCPTCRASQPWADACRRCRSDLRLLREFAGACARARRDCLRLLRAGRPRAAREAAARCLAMAPGDESRRLMAVASLRAGDWAAAASSGRDRPAGAGS